ncbi:MAG: universal stress protein [Acidobacteriota bacterium]
MFSRILVASDLSLASERVLDCVAGWKAGGLQKVVIAHVHNIGYAAGAAGLEESLRRDHEPKLEAQAQRIRDAGLHARWRLEFGVPYLEIQRIAEEEGCEAVVIGSHGASWVKEVWLGSIGDAILRHVQKTPVLVIKVNRLLELTPGECDGFCNSLFTKALIATDFSSGAQSALRIAEQLAGRYQAELHLVHVQERVRLFPHLVHRLEEFNEEDRRRLEEIAQRLRNAGASAVSWALLTEHPVPGILQAIAEWEPRLVVVGRRGRGGPARRLIGSTSHDVARESPVPVLVTPATVSSEEEVS